MAAGSVGMKARSSGRDLHEQPRVKGLETLSVESGWWMYVKMTEEAMKETKEARHKAFKEKHGRGIFYDSDE